MADVKALFFVKVNDTMYYQVYKNLFIHKEFRQIIGLTTVHTFSWVPTGPY